VQLVISGIAGTVAMTLFTSLVFRVANRPYRVVKILGSMLQFRSRTFVLQKVPTRFFQLATIVHYTIGIVFAIGYHYFVHTTGNRAASGSVIYGILIGIIAIAGWRLFFEIHPGPPEVDLPLYLGTIGVGHIILASVMFLFFAVVQVM
jgi:hypothetical protein